MSRKIEEFAERFRGPLSEILTPFDETGAVDYDLLENEIEHQVQNQINGLFINGLPSEGLLLTKEEKAKIAERVVEYSDGRVPIMGNITGNSIAETKNLVREYEYAGVDALGITPPFTYPYSDGALLSHFISIAESTDLPVFVYNEPATGNQLSPTDVGTIINTVPNVVGYKDSTKDIAHLQSVFDSVDTDKTVNITAGSDSLILPIMQLGGSGVISLVSTVFPQLIVDFFAAYNDGDVQEARELQQKILRVRSTLKIGPFMAGYKYASKLNGNPRGSLRAPLEELSDEEKRRIEKNINQEEML